ncbi:hypothetical protein CIHG_02049 [Coccidioides immitis H538.4]|uniref:Uncharacterized protein n=1 Tax=Coccidioides immitis H538.4 TaxID=396776 RepID=A0A0J8UB05_COCIT|nr:hypothetical protein CIHG_02049 [Coccidioides immitis H538.4]
MVKLSRQRQKAVDGLDKILFTEQEWLEMVTMYSLMNAKLQDLCSYEVMAVGNALLYILRMGLYFSEEHVAQATKLINRKLLGLDKHPKCLHLEDFNAMDDHPAPSKPSILPNIELPEETLDEIPDEILDPWTPTKTLVVNFMVNLLEDLACLLQPLAYQTVCVANVFETTYQFGPLPNGLIASNHIQFQACIDGSISFSLPPDKNLPEMVIFEVKCAHYETGQDVPVVGQQSMKHVAYI